MRIVRVSFFALLCGGALALASPGMRPLPHTGQSPFALSHPRGGPPPQCGGTLLSQVPRTVVPGSSVACIQDFVDRYHYDNSLWRSFVLAESSITGRFDVCRIIFGVSQAISGSGTGQPLSVNLYSTDAAFPSGTLSLLNSVTIPTFPDNALPGLVFMPLPAVAPSGSEVVVEIHVPDGTATEDLFFLGANPQPETSPSYISAATGDCDIPTPVTTASFGFPNAHWVLEVEGNEIRPATPLSVDERANGETVSNLNGVLEVGETVLFEASYENPGSLNYGLTATATGFSGPDGLTYAIVDDTADYGVIPAQGVRNCRDLEDCYALQILSGARPQQHVDLMVDESAPLVSTTTLGSGVSPPLHSWTLHVGESFADAPTTNIFYAFIENIFHHGVTAGCDPTNYCPANVTLRKQMAVFVLKALEGPAYTPPPATGVFTDVPANDSFAPWIEGLYARGVVGGCGPGPTYCPDSPVLRQQMAVFLLKTLLGDAYTPPGCTGLFGDVPCPGLFTDWVEDLYTRGITGGCSASPLLYCPASSVTRGQMAPFLAKTFGLALYGL